VARSESWARRLVALHLDCELVATGRGEGYDEFADRLAAESTYVSFPVNPRLDFRVPFVTAVYQICLNHLVKVY
jgi:hypothetical protein